MMAGGTLISLVLLHLLCAGEGFKDFRSFEDEILDSCDMEPILVPKLYEIKLDLDFHQRTFNGEVIITGNVLQETKNILLDSSINVTESTIYDLDGYTNLVLLNNQTDSILNIEFENPLQPNKDYKLMIQYEGEIRHVRGIFGKNYSTSKSDSYFVATEFQPNYASHAFPCIDKPKYKARFTLNVSREAHHIARSNMPLESSHLDIFNENKVWDSFMETPLMSTYTFAFVVGDFVPVRSEDCRSDSNGNSLPVHSEDCNIVDSTGEQTIPDDCNGEESKDEADSNRNPTNTVWVIKGLERLGCTARKWAPLFLQAIENYTGIPYELPKLDHVALPVYVSVAMEHWGMISYKQDMILIDEESNSIKSKFGLKWVMAHEMVHQWFGNLVTCSSWRYTWLNEGVTSFLHFLISGKVFPEWDMLGLMMAEDVQKVMDDEAYSAVELTKQDCIMEVSNSFSLAAYYKGAALMRMVYFTIGEDALQKGLNNYLSKNNHNSVTQEDLWMNFEKFAELGHVLPHNTSLSTVMQTWTDNYGFPLITVTRNETISLTQERLEHFYLDDLPEQQWWIPITYTTSSERNFSKTVPRIWMLPNEQVTYINKQLRQDEWILFNIKQSGYYRVLYDELSWSLLCKQLMDDYTVIPPLSRASLIDDVFTLAMLNRTNYRMPLTLAKYLVKETHYYPWMSVIKSLEQFESYIMISHLNETYQNFVLGLVSNIYTKLSKERKDINDNLLYYKILSLACMYGHKGCEEKARDTMDRLLSGEVDYAKKHQDEVYHLMCTMIRLGGEEIWDLGFEMYIKERHYKKKEELRETLKCSRNEKVIKNWAKKYIDGEMHYNSIDFNYMFDKRSYCYIIELLENELNENPKRIEDLASFIDDISVHLPEECSKKLQVLAETYLDENDREDIIKSIKKHRKVWVRLKEFEEWFDEEANKLEGRILNENSDQILDTSSPHRRQLHDEMVDDAVDLSYPHSRQPQDYDYEGRHGQASQISSAVSTEFNSYILLLSILPSPFYLTYLIFAPFL